MLKRRTMVGGFVTLLFFVVSGVEQSTMAAKSIPSPYATSTVGFRQKICKLSGVCCLNCAKHLKKVLGAIPGIHKAEIDFHAGEATLRYDPRRVTEAQIAESIDSAGFACNMKGTKDP